MAETSSSQYIEAWLSLVERCVRDAEVVGSNPVASMNKDTTESDWQGICVAEGVVAARPVDARSATTGAERRPNPVASTTGNPK